MTKFKAHLWIHGWSITHGITAAATAQSLDGGFEILTMETIAAVGSFSKACGATWSTAFINSFVKQQFANRVGVEIARQTAGKIPVFGNTFNGITSAVITEAILWETYAMCA